MLIFLFFLRKQYMIFFSTIPPQKSSLATENDHSMSLSPTLDLTLLYQSSQFNRGVVSLFLTDLSTPTKKISWYLSCTHSSLTLEDGHRPSYIAFVSCPFTCME